MGAWRHGRAVLTGLILLASGMACQNRIAKPTPEAPRPAPAVDNADEQLFHKVMDRLLNSELATREYPGKYDWPPRHFVKPDSQEEINAYATAAKSLGAEVDEKTGKVRPAVMVTEGMLKEVVKGDENSLAVIMGHELAHLTKDHVAGQKGDTQLLTLAFGRDQEIEADLTGLRYAVSAGYPYKAGVAKAIQEMRVRTRYTSFEGLGVSHPSWEERLALLDREQPQLWSAMSAFQNGFLFLALEQYPSAQQCFKAVVTEFPDCYEAWANLGYAQLMRYCDGLETEDLRHFGIGQIVAGGFYSRPASLESKVRGVDEKLWQDAVKALKRALTLKSDLALPRAHLGVAYLVDPEGKNAKQASKWFAEALDHLQQDPELQRQPLALAALRVNAGVADLARGDAAEASRQFQVADAACQEVAFFPGTQTLRDALLYNQALPDARSPEADRKRKACEALERYLSRACPDSAWWPLAHELYAKLAKELKIAPRPPAELAARERPDRLRLLTSLTVDGHPVTLSEPIDGVVTRLGKDAAVALPLFPDSKIVRWRFAARGIELLGKDRVLAIFVTDPKAPPVTVQATGLGARPRELRVGMTKKEVGDILKGQRSDLFPRPIADPEVRYQFYPELGLAVRYAGEYVRELAIAQIPRRSFLK